MDARGERRGGDPGTEASVGLNDPVAVFRMQDIVEGWIPKLEGRMSDGLNEAERMRVQTSRAEGSPEQWMDLDLDDVVAVAAPPRAPSSARVTRRQHAVEIDAGPYHVRGIVHLPLGADPKRYVAGTARRWLPLTSCTVAVGEDAFEVDVVIVNMDYAARRQDPVVVPTPPG